MATSARRNKLARQHMADHPGTRYQQALEAVRTRDEEPRGARTLPNGPEAWLRALGDIPTAGELEQRWAAAADSASLRFPIGVRVGPDFQIGDDPEVLWIDLAEPSRGGCGPHAILTGRTGSGVTYALKAMLTGLATHHGPDRLRFVFAEYCSRDLTAAFGQITHTASAIPSLGRNSDAVVEWCDRIGAEIERRETRIFAENGCKDIFEYRASPAGQADALPELLVVIADADRMMDEHPYASGVIKRLLRMGRCLGFNLLLTCQSASRLAQRNVLEHLSVRLSFAVSNSSDSRAVIGTDAAARMPLAVPGAAYLDRTKLPPGLPTSLRTFDVGPHADKFRSLLEAMPRSAYRFDGV